MPTYVTLSEAATFLGVSKSTLRNWDREGKLVAVRNPLNRYRTYDLDKLSKIKKDNPITVPVEVVKEDFASSKKIVDKLSDIVRDEEGNSNIIERFDDMTKLFFIKFSSSGNVFEREFGESAKHYASRIRETYSNISINENFSSINLKDTTILKCGMVLNTFDTSSNIDIKGLLYEEAIKSSFDKNDNQQFFTPRVVVDFIESFYEEYLTGNICDPACGTAGFLIRVDEDDNTKLFGFEIDQRLAWISKVNLIAHNHSNYEIHCLENGGSLGPGIDDFKNTIDLIITNPPFGSDFSDTKLLSRFILGKDRTSRRRGVLFIEQAYNLLKNDGRVAIIIDDSVLNSLTNLDVRQFIMSHFQIEAIISLPETTFLPYANVNSSILFMKKTNNPVSDHVFYAKSEKVGRKGNGDDDILYNEDGSQTLNSDLDNILKLWRTGNVDEHSFYCNLSACFNSDSTKRIDYVYNHPFRSNSMSILSRCSNLMLLSEICLERNESYIPSANIDVNTIAFTGLADIESYTGKARQVMTPSASIQSSVKRYEPGDIIFSRMRPNLRKVAVMNFKQSGFVSSECVVLTVRKDPAGHSIIDPNLLSTILRSDFVYGQIMHLVTGIGRPRISPSDIRRIKVPVDQQIEKDLILQIDAQEKMISEMRKRAQVLIEEADELEKTTINDIAIKAARI